MRLGVLEYIKLFVVVLNQECAASFSLWLSFPFVHQPTDIQTSSSNFHGPFWCSLQLVQGNVECILMPLSFLKGEQKSSMKSIKSLGT